MLAQQKYLHTQHPAHFDIPTGFVLIFFTPQRVCVCPPLPLLALHLFQPLPKLWMQQSCWIRFSQAKPRLQQQQDNLFVIIGEILLCWKPGLHTSSL